MKINKNIIIGIVIALVFVLVFVVNIAVNNKNDNGIKGKHYVEIVVKDYGVIDLELDADVAPITVANFIDLVEDKFYDGLTFHRIIDGFMVQGGQSYTKDAKNIKGEFESNGVKNNISHVRGVISMARVDGYPDSASSQFFIVHQDSTFLDGNYAAFGKVVRGMDVVDNLAKVEVTDNNGTVEEDKQPIIESIKVIDKDKLEWTEDE